MANCGLGTFRLVAVLQLGILEDVGYSFLRMGQKKQINAESAERGFLHYNPIRRRLGRLQSSKKSMGRTELCQPDTCIIQPELSRVTCQYEH